MSSRVNHSSCGMKAAYDMHLLDVAFAIAGHHAGLPDGGNHVDSVDESTFMSRVKSDYPDASHWQDEIQLPSCQPIRRRETCYTAMMRIRMQESTLVDADRLDAEFFVNGEVDRAEAGFLTDLLDSLGPGMLEKSKEPSPDELIEQAKVLAERMHDHNVQVLRELAGHMERRAQALLTTSQPGSLNEKRNKILSACLNHGRNPSWKPGLYTLTAPTGSGKTDSSLTFALEHAVANHMDRVIYIVPYTSIIDQTVQDFVNLLGSRNVLPHYADASFQLKERDELNVDDLHRSFAAENWNMPIVVTTAVQFFESLYASKASRLRKIHNIANAVLVFDEAQTLPVPFLKPCIQAIAELVGHYKSSAVLCTATQPALQELFAAAFEDDGLVIPEIAPISEDERRQFNRNRIVQDGHVSLDQMAENLQKHKQVLCVVNKRKEAQDLYRAISKDRESSGIYCLTTLQCAYDRNNLFKEIRERLSAGKPCTVISTSLIEAGVDVDFPEVYREEAGLDSILQTAGRCNREGRHDAQQSLVHVFSTDEGKMSLLSPNVAALKAVEKSVVDLSSTEAIHAYFTNLLDMKQDGRSLDINKILEAHELGINGCNMPFRKIEDMFKLIDTPTVPVYIPVNKEADRLCARLSDPTMYKRGLFRALGQYAVNVWPQQLRALKDAGKVVALAETGGDEENDGAFVLLDSEVYNYKLGLRINEEQLPQEGIYT